jgi:hypothetical protein
VKHTDNPYALATFIVLSLGLSTWLLVDTVRGWRAGKLRFEIFVDDRKNKPGFFWSNVVLRSVIVASLAAAGVLMLTSLLAEISN